MKYLDTYRDPRAARALLDEIRASVTHPWTVLEVCGGQAQNLLRCGIDRDLPPGFELIHGPGCPSCATPSATIDRAIATAGRPGVIVAAAGDLLRMPGSRGHQSLLTARSDGADVRLVYSPLDALALARKHPDRQVVMVVSGFETTAPAATAALVEAERLGLDNLTLLCAFFRLAPAIEAILSAPGHRAQAVLAAGPVCAVTGYREYTPLAERFQVPVIVTGPEPVDLLDALARAVHQLERRSFQVENQYERAVRPDGNLQARAALDTVFEPADAEWRGLGVLPASGLALRERFRQFDARERFPDAAEPRAAASDCFEGEVLAGRLMPIVCPAFGTRCTPDHPLGASMASVEGTCAAYYRYRRQGDPSSSHSTLTAIPTSAVPGTK